MYTIETLKEINHCYDHEHKITQYDVDIANKWIGIIENSRNNLSPQIGDIVEYTTNHGDYYSHAHIERIDGEINNELNICECPYVPFIGLIENRFYTSTSGGAWVYISKNLKLIGTKQKLFNDWGHCGACGNGAIQFYANVNVWEYKEENSLYNEYTTKTHDKFYVSYRDNVDDYGYKYIITKGATNYKAFRTDKEYKAWLKTFNGIEFNGYWENQKVVWTFKQFEKCIPLEEYNKIENYITDSELCNATIQECKRQYIDTTIFTYLPYQYEKIELPYKVEYIKAYETL